MPNRLALIILKSGVERNPNNPGVQMKILIIDDSPLASKALKRALERKGHRVDIVDAQNRPMVAFALTAPYGHCIMDFDGHPVDAWTAVAALKRIPVTIWTGSPVVAERHDWRHQPVAIRGKTETDEIIESLS